MTYLAHWPVIFASRPPLTYNWEKIWRHCFLDAEINRFVGNVEERNKQSNGRDQVTEERNKEHGISEKIDSGSTCQLPTETAPFILSLKRRDV